MNPDEKKQAVIVTSFGTTVEQARGSIEAVEETLAACAPGCTFLRAFTSPTIRRILTGRGEWVPGLSEAMEQLHGQGFSHVIVQPTHLLYGYEYDNLHAEAVSLSARFASVKIGRPLLSDNQAIQQFAGRLCQTHPARKDHAAVFIGHGTAHFANAAYPALQTALRLFGRDDLYIGTVESWPGLSDVIRELAPYRSLEVDLVPLMLTAGEHAKKDMAVSWKNSLEQAGHTVSCSFQGLGELPWVQQMYQERLSEVL